MFIMLMPMPSSAQFQSVLSFTYPYIFNSESVLSDKIEGHVFHDLDIDGEEDTNEDGKSGITIELYDEIGLVASVLTNSNGDFSFGSLLQNKNYQVKIGVLPSGWSQTKIGIHHRSGIINLTTIEDPVLMGIYDYSSLCHVNPDILTPCYVEGTYNGSITGDAAIVKVKAAADGHHFNGINYTAQYEAQAIASYGQVGTVYGLAWQPPFKRYYAAAFHKRYTDFGPGGADAIYQLDLSGNVTGLLHLDNLTGSSNTTGGNVHDLTVAGDGNVYDLGSSDNSFDAVGKRAYGDIEISGDGNTLYVVNLWDKKIYALDISTGMTTSVSLINSWNCPDATGVSSHRPFGLAWHDDVLWIGSVDQNSLNAYVHSFNPTNGQSILRLTIPLNYSRQAFYGDADNPNAPGEWNIWAVNSSLSYYNPTSEIAFPQAILSDIEFSNEGAMILGFRDRFGDQAGAGKKFRPSDGNLTWAIAEGDILKACFIGGNYILETGNSGVCSGVGGNTNSGPGGEEFYHWDIYEFENSTWNPNINTGAFHWETTQGGLIQLDSQDYIITTALDPFHDFSGGLLKLDNTTGGRDGVGVGASSYGNLTGGYTIYEGGDFNGGLPTISGYAGKANGLGDLEAACELDLMIGNFVWLDSDGDGIQDPDENGIDGLTVSLYQNNILIGTAMTTDGFYWFGGSNQSNLNIGQIIRSNTNYELRVDLPVDIVTSNNTNKNLNHALTIVNVNSNNSDLQDNDASLLNNQAVIAFPTGELGLNNYSLDIGFIGCVVKNEIVNYLGCSGDGYSIVVNGNTYDQNNKSGIETLTSIEGCDSLVNIDLVFDAPADTTMHYIGEVGDGYELNIGGTTYNESNPVGTETLLTSVGCDSLVHINFQFVMPSNTTECQIVIQDGFETGYGNWTDGGSDCRRINNSSRAGSGTRSIRLRDNSNSSHMTTGDLDFSTVDTVKVSFHYHPVSFEGAEDFWLQISTNGGASYSTVKAWVHNVDFTNNVPDDETVSIPGPFSSNTRIRFRCDASSNQDFVHIDDVIIESCEEVTLPCPVVSIADITTCAGGTISIDGAPIGGGIPYLSHLWTALPSSTSTGFLLSLANSQLLSLDLSSAISGDIVLEYRVIDQNSCVTTDTMIVSVLSDPACLIESDLDTLCSGAQLELKTPTRYLVNPMAGFVPSAGSGVGVTVVHDIIGIVDPASTMITVTLPTWDDHFDSILLNGNMIIPEIFETASYDPVGMDCVTPWYPNLNGLPRSIITIQNGIVRYYSSKTTTSTVMTEVFPAAWTTTPQNFIEGDNTFQFGIQNTNGPVSGSWNIEVTSNLNYTYLWNTGATTESTNVSPDTTTTYSVTITSPTGCQTSCEKTIVVKNLEVNIDPIDLCVGSVDTIVPVIVGDGLLISHDWSFIGGNNGLNLSDTSSAIVTIDASIAVSGFTNLVYTALDQYGCTDSDTILINVLPSYSDTFNYSLCDGDTLNINGLTIANSGTFPVLLNTVSGCDSAIVYNVIVHPSYNQDVSYEGCSGDGYQQVINGTLYDESNPVGIEILTTQNSCDSIINVTFVYHPDYNETRNYNGCSDDGYSLVVNGTTYDVSNPSGIETMTSVHNCDSIININLIFDLAATVEAGMLSEPICSNSYVDLLALGASISGGVSSGTWTSTGGGVFDGGASYGVSLTYTPSSSEIDLGIIILTLTSDDPPGGCEPEADAVMILINDLRCSRFPWAGN